MNTLTVHPRPRHIAVNHLNSTVTATQTKSDVVVCLQCAQDHSTRFMYHSQPQTTQTYQDTPTELNNNLALLFVDDPTHGHLITKLLAIHFTYEFRWNLKHVQMHHV